MKKILIVLVLVLAMAYPAGADNAYKLIVNDKLIDKPVVMIEDTTYVPIRVVADAFNATTDWNAQTKIISVKTKQIDPQEINRPPIKGDKEFVAKVNSALDLLESKDFPHYWMVCQNTFNITQLTERPEWDPDTILARSFFSATVIYPKLTQDSKRYTPEYLAGVLVHEACHNTITNYDREQSEKVCYAHELAVFKTLDAPQWMQDECLNR